jgi:predicted ArsR family transcriptional regulator
MLAVAEPIDADTLRIRHEFLTRADLSVSADEVAERLGVPLRHALRMLESLVFEGFLGRMPDARYIRVIAGAGIDRY